MSCSAWQAEGGVLLGTPLCSGCAGLRLQASKKLQEDVQKCSKAMPSPCFSVMAALQGKLETQARKTCSGMSNWKITTSGKSYIELLEDQREELVYLTADSEDTLEELDPIKLYIIGGLVDRNRHKNVCANRAAEQVSCPLDHGKHASAEMAKAPPTSCRAAVAWPLHERVQASSHLLLHRAAGSRGLMHHAPCQLAAHSCTVDVTMPWPGSHRRVASLCGCSQGAGLLCLLSRSPS